MVQAAGLPGNIPTPTPENPASRWARDAQARRGDNQMAKDGSGNAILDARGWTTLTYNATSRNDREYNQRRGDWYVTSTNGVQSLTYDPNGRNDREYVAYATGISAITGAKGDRFDNLKAHSSGA